MYFVFFSPNFFHLHTISNSFFNLNYSSCCCCYVIHLSWHSNTNLSITILYYFLCDVYLWRCCTTLYWSKNRSFFHYFLYNNAFSLNHCCIYDCIYVLFILYSILIPFLLYLISSISIRQSFRNNLSKLVPATAKNRYVFL